MVLKYQDAPKDYFDYKLHYLETPIIVKFNYRVRIFKCAAMRIGVTNMHQGDKAVLLSNLRNVAGSLPITAKSIRKLFVQKYNDYKTETMFINFNPELAGVFGSQGQPLKYEELANAFEARLAITILGMKVKDDESSYMIRVHQVMVKKMFNNVAPSGTQLMFDVSSGDEDNM